jgi:hypothetical protein
VSNGGDLRGQLSEFRLEELLQMMGFSSTSGALHLRERSGRIGLIYFDSGALVSCSELDTEALTLGHVLQQLDLVSAPQLDHAFQQQMQDPLGKRIGERLMEQGALSMEELNRALQTQTLWTARELSLWSEGAYEFHPGEQLPSGTSPLRLESMQVVLEVLRYRNEWKSLQPFLPDGMRSHVMMAFEPPIGHPLVFHAQAWRVISRVNSHHTVRRIATSLHLPELDIARMIGPLVQEGLLVPAGAAGGPGLPEEAERLSLDRFDLFTLLISMEQDWLKRKSAPDQLVALAGFINQTMLSLEQACEVAGLGLAPNTLESLLGREHLSGMGEYRFRIAQNRLDTDDFAAYCRRMFEGSARGPMGASKAFYDKALDTLMAALGAAFEAINSRIASPEDRSQNREAWEALFQTFTDGVTR